MQAELLSSYQYILSLLLKLSVSYIRIIVPSLFHKCVYDFKIFEHFPNTLCLLDKIWEEKQKLRKSIIRTHECMLMMPSINFLLEKFFHAFDEKCEILTINVCVCYRTKKKEMPTHFPCFQR